MSQDAASYGPHIDQRAVVGIESGLEALRSSPEFRGPVESLDGHHCNDHFAQIYENNVEKFSAAIPFVRQGLERGERVMYVIDESSRSEVLSEFEDVGIDLDDALESGALTFHTVQETYLRNETFVPDEMIDFYAAAVEEVADEYAAFRVVAETTWLQEETTTIADFMEYESKINDLFENEDCLALCQYDRNGFPPEVVRDIVKTHPHLIVEDTVCHNFYYTPPGEFFGPDEPAREVDRMLGTMVDRTCAKTMLQARQEYQRELYEITADPDRSFEEKLDALFELGCERFDLELGGMARVDPATDYFEVEHVSDDHEHLRPGAQVALSETYCRVLADGGKTAAVTDPAADGFEGTIAHDKFGVQSYLGTRLEMDTGPDRTFFLVSSEPRAEPFSEEERTFHRLMGQWVSYELERQQRERFLQESYEITSRTDCSFAEKLEQLLTLGCEWFDLEVGSLTHLPEWGGDFEIEMVVSAGEGPQTGISPVQPGDDCFCRQAINSEAPVGVPDIRDVGWADDPVHQQYGITSYFGTRVTVDSKPYGTLWFGDTSPSEGPFTEPQRTFLELMGQWVSYELERKERQEYQRELYDIAADTDRSFEEKLDALFELGCERFDLELGGMARVDPATDYFEVEHVSDDHEHLRPGAQAALSETYCHLVTENAETAHVTDPMGSGFDDLPSYREFGVNDYFGTYLELEGDFDRTLWFVSTASHEDSFSEEKRTFLQLMGQWVKYELEREQRERQLAALNDMGRELMNAETLAEIAERTVDHARKSLQLPVTALVEYDRRSGSLSPSAQTPQAEDELPTATLCAPDSGPLWETFVANETRILDDVASVAGAGADITEVVAVPLGREGLFVTATRATDGFADSTLDFVQATAATVKAAFTRADREQQLAEREDALEAQNETLERLNRINDIIRSIDQALVNASTRAEIESVVCERLADTGPYDLAWIGEHDAVTDEIAPREWAGNQKGYLDEIVVTADEDSPRGQGPTGRAVRTREPQVVNNVLDDPPYEPWRQAALNRGYHATIALPLVYEGSLYGVLNVYAGQPGVFDELERAVLAELSDTIAYAINAVESKKALVSDTVTELKFDIHDAAIDIVDVCRDLGCSMTLESVVPQSDGRLRIFFTIRGVDPEAFTDAASRLPVTELSLLAEHESDGEPVGLFEGLLTDESFYAKVLEHGGVPRELSVGSEDAHVLVELASDAETREFVTTFQTNYPGTRLVAQQAKERSARSPTTVYGLLTEALTDRQLEVLQTAYFSGYFEKPRSRTGSEIASSLDITQPTFNHHVRAAHRKLCHLLFEDTNPFDGANVR